MSVPSTHHLDDNNFNSSDAKQLKIISDLELISSIQPGQTLSISSMTVLNHKSWGSSLLRRYNGEDRKSTIGFIEGVLIESVSFCELSLDPAMFLGIESALKGFLSLKETYKRDYYTIGEIDRIVDNIKVKLLILKNNIKIYLNIKDDSVETLSHDMENFVYNELLKSNGHIDETNSNETLNSEESMVGEITSDSRQIDKKKHNKSSNIVQENESSASNLQKMVETSNRTSIEKTIKCTVESDVAGDGSKSSDRIPDLSSTDMNCNNTPDSIKLITQNSKQKNWRSKKKYKITKLH